MELSFKNNDLFEDESGAYMEAISLLRSMK